MKNLNYMALFADFNHGVRFINEKYRLHCYHAFCVLCRADNIYKMINAIELGLPPMNVVCKDMERIADCSNIYIRQIIGKEMRYILSLFGYDIDESVGRQRLRSFCGAKHFKTGPVYKQVRKSKYTIKVDITEA